jgi:hypothetical protein
VGPLTALSAPFPALVWRLTAPLFRKSAGFRTDGAVKGKTRTGFAADEAVSARSEVSIGRLQRRQSKIQTGSGH